MRPCPVRHCSGTGRPYCIEHLDYSISSMRRPAQYLYNEKRVVLESRTWAEWETWDGKAKSDPGAPAEIRRKYGGQARQYQFVCVVCLVETPKFQVTCSPMCGQIAEVRDDPDVMYMLACSVLTEEQLENWDERAVIREYHGDSRIRDLSKRRAFAEGAALAEIVKRYGITTEGVHEGKTHNY